MTPTEVQTDFTTPEIVWQWLRKPFKPEQIGRLPATAKRPALDFVGHAAVTDRLNKCAPGQWTFTIDERFDHAGQCWVRITLTVLGVSRSEYGDGSDPKEALGNAIRRAAMRFGVAIDLWSKEDLAAGAGGGGSDTPSFAPRPASESPPVTERVNGEESDMVAGGSTSESAVRQTAADNRRPDQASAGEGERLTGKRANSNSPADDTAKVHVHEWSDHWTDQKGKVQAARQGWVVCTSCGKAELAKKVSA